MNRTQTVRDVLATKLITIMDPILKSVIVDRPMIAETIITIVIAKGLVTVDMDAAVDMVITVNLAPEKIRAIITAVKTTPRSIFFPSLFPRLSS